jgi:hypothetical protein
MICSGLAFRLPTNPTVVVLWHLQTSNTPITKGKCPPILIHRFGLTPVRSHFCLSTFSTATAEKKSCRISSEKVLIWLHMCKDKVVCKMKLLASILTRFPSTPRIGQLWPASRVWVGLVVCRIQSYCAIHRRLHLLARVDSRLSWISHKRQPTCIDEMKLEGMCSHACLRYPTRSNGQQHDGKDRRRR